MKRLTENEIKFIKETGVTWTVVQCNEWRSRTSVEHGDEARAIAKSKYNVDFDSMLDKFSEYDSISLEYTATYLFYTFFSKEVLESFTAKEALKWLEDMKYFCGFRKWDEYSAAQEINEALEVYNGTRRFYEVGDGEVWNKKIE